MSVVGRCLERAISSFFRELFNSRLRLYGIIIIERSSGEGKQDENEEEKSENFYDEVSFPFSAHFLKSSSSTIDGILGILFPILRSSFSASTSLSAMTTTLLIRTSAETFDFFFPFYPSFEYIFF